MDIIEIYINLCTIWGENSLPNSYSAKFLSQMSECLLYLIYLMKIYAYSKQERHTYILQMSIAYHHESVILFESLWLA